MKDKVILCLVTILFFTFVSVGVKFLVVPKITHEEKSTTAQKTTASAVTEKITETSTTTTTTVISTTKKTTQTTQIQVQTVAPIEPKTTTATPTTTTTKKVTEQVYDATGMEAEMLKIVNNERAKHGVAPLSLDPTLIQMSQTRAKELASNYSSDHKRPDGSEWHTILASLNGTSLQNWCDAGENIGYGQSTCKEIMEDWIASPTHYNNIIKSTYTHAGFACYSRNGVLYWNQIFIGI